MDVPAIGKARGIFEVFIPGVFLQLNLVWMLYWFEYQYVSDTIIQSPSKENPILNPIILVIKDSPILMLIIIIAFGYLTGIILWLLKADLPDKLSASLRKLLKSDDEEFYHEDFPFINSLGSVVKKNLPNEANLFYANCWKPRAAGSRNKYFFNYCKLLINSIDDKSSNENYAGEAMIRYFAAMFYAILISLIFSFFILLPMIFSTRNIDATIILVMAYTMFYIISLIVILWNFRYMRFKEVQTVFTASLMNQEFINQDLNDNYRLNEYY